MAGHRKDMLDVQKIIQLKARGESNRSVARLLGQLEINIALNNIKEVSCIKLCNHSKPLKSPMIACQRLIIPPFSETIVVNGLFWYSSYSCMP